MYKRQELGIDFICHTQSSFNTMHFFSIIFILCSGFKRWSIPVSYTHLDNEMLRHQMPGMDGMETAKVLRQDNEDMILIFVTAAEEYVFQDVYKRQG